MPRFLGGRFLTGEFLTMVHCSYRSLNTLMFRLWYFMCFYFCQIFPCGVGAASIARCLSWILEFFVSSLVLVDFPSSVPYVSASMSAKLLLPVWWFRQGDGRTKCLGAYPFGSRSVQGHHVVLCHQLLRQIKDCPRCIERAFSLPVSWIVSILPSSLIDC